MGFSGGWKVLTLRKVFVSFYLQWWFINWYHTTLGKKYAGGLYLIYAEEFAFIFICPTVVRWSVFTVCLKMPFDNKRPKDIVLCCVEIVIWLNLWWKIRCIKVGAGDGRVSSVCAFWRNSEMYIDFVVGNELYISRNEMYLKLRL